MNIKLLTNDRTTLWYSDSVHETGPHKGEPYLKVMYRVAIPKISFTDKTIVTLEEPYRKDLKATIESVDLYILYNECGSIYNSDNGKLIASMRNNKVLDRIIEDIVPLESRDRGIITMKYIVESDFTWIY
jgi:hypothetical protein